MNSVATNSSIDNAIKIKLFAQRIISFLVLPILYSFYWISVYLVRRHTIPQIKQLRRHFKHIRQQSSEPLLICPNHLTYVDSIILIIAIGSFLDYWRNFYSFAWNFPKTTHMKTNLFYQVICYIGKCVFINLDSPREQHNQPMHIAKYLLSKGEYLMLFPEGHRGHNGLVDTNNFTYGVGKLINEFKPLKLLCVYLRGSSQQTASNYPNKYDSFYCQLNLVDLPPQDAKNSALRNIRNNAKYIIQQLHHMEQEYFTNNNMPFPNKSLNLSTSSHEI
jgi:1-acyl-sn-glycerol-3-phosphate acyltransferase